MEQYAGHVVVVTTASVNFPSLSKIDDKHYSSYFLCSLLTDDNHISLLPL